MIIDISVHKDRFDRTITLDLIHMDNTKFPITWTESRELTNEQYKKFIDLVYSIT